MRSLVLLRSHGSAPDLTRPAIYSKAEQSPAMARKKQTFDMKNEVRKLARERVGTVPSSRPILPKSQRNKPKHKKPITGEDDAPG
jgi:hypothetical protein